MADWGVVRASAPRPLVYALAPLGVAHEEIVADDCAVVERCLAHLRPGCTQAHNVANLVTVGDEVVGDDTPVAPPPHLSLIHI